REQRLALRRCDLAFEALQRPVAAACHLLRDGRQRNDRTDLLALPAELERRDVTLDTVVVRGERRRARELDRAVLTDEPAARDGGRGDETDGGDRRDERKEQTDGTRRAGVVRLRHESLRSRRGSEGPTLGNS